MAIALPRIMVLKSFGNFQYLRRISKKESVEDNVAETFVYFKEDDITSPVIKFETEAAKTNEKLVHIRCCNNNKYLCVTEDLYIQAAAPNPIENDGVSSTMFQAVQALGYPKDNFRFLHPGTKRYAVLKSDTTVYDEAFYTDDSFPIDAGNVSYVFTVLDWASLVLFPNSVSFSDINDKTKFLSCRDGDAYLHFVDDQSIGDLRVVNEIITKSDGYIRIKNVSTGKFWKRDEDNYILANSTDTTWMDQNTIFRPEKFAKQVVALKSLGNGKFCNKEKGGKFLKAEEDTIMNETKLWVSESVILSTMYGFDFDTANGRVYNIHNPIVEGSSIEYTNFGSKETDSIDLKVSYQKTKSQFAETNVSLSLGMETTLKFGAIPLIVDGEIEMSGQYTYEREGKDESSDAITVETTYKAKVPPKTLAKVTLDVKKGKCDVPFSYFKRDTHYDGKTTVTQMHDGIYTGVNMFSAKYRVTRNSLPKA
ncbi:hypothetical protein G4B88_015463 [Cannabis sativa]|uniref:Agglutinin domain-containing protein n=1 Tax=Cannabis sativa TaxID=3483 RepID=A0A7J6DIX2_CANSA|nr:hypothetical protein G4B88_015463 [Cannabis sativa]